MATIANQNGRHMVQHFLLPVNIHFHWNLFIFELMVVNLSERKFKTLQYTQFKVSYI
jgi:Ulp1 family protease